MQITLEQPAQFTAMLHCGLVIGILYDFFAFFRLLFKGRFALSLCDVLFCALGVAVLAAYWYAASRLVFRFYLFFGLGLGFLLQFYAIKPIIKQLYAWAWGGAARLLGRAKKGGFLSRLLK